MKTSHIKAQKGFTLIELMVATVILAILVSAGVPAMQSLFANKNIKTVGKFFEQSIKLARTEAIQRSAIVRVKPTANSFDWSQGWYLEYTNESGSNELIRRFDALPGSPSFDSKEFSQATPLEILPDGQVRNIGTFKLFYQNCTANEVLTYQILLSGILRRAMARCSN